MDLAGLLTLFHQDHFLALAHGAVDDFPHRDQAHVVAVIQVGDQELQRRGLRVILGRGNGAEDGSKSGTRSCPWPSGSVRAMPALALV